MVTVSDTIGRLYDFKHAFYQYLTDVKTFKIPIFTYLIDWKIFNALIKNFV
jgi:hypothetical protein